MRAGRFLLSLSVLSDEMTAWREQGRSKTEAVAQKIYDPEDVGALERLFAKGVSQKDYSGEWNYDLGFSVLLWNGKNETLSINCGLYSSVPALSNAVILKIPKSFDVKSIDNTRRLIAAFVAAWDPDWVAVTAQSKLNHAGTDQHGRNQPFLDRGLYMKSSQGNPAFSSDVIEVRFGSGLVFLQN